MAFNRVRPSGGGKAIVYALNLNGLSALWRKHTTDSLSDMSRWEGEELFRDGFPLNTLQPVLLPASWNTRMLRQMGLFVYDSLQYGKGVPYKDLEDFIEKGDDGVGTDGEQLFTVQKIYIPHADAREVFERLDLMGIDGTRLLDNHEGAAADVVNGYVYNTRVGIPYDLQEDWQNEGGGS